MPDGSAVRQIERASQGHASPAAFAGLDMLAPANRNLSANLTILIAVPTLESGAADTNALDLVKLLHGAGHRPVVVSSGGRLTGAVTANGGEFIAMNVASKNPIVMMACARKLSRLIAQRGCDVVHALGRAPAWSAYTAARINGKPFVTTCYKGFREQNFLKRLNNGVMAKGDRVIAASEDISDLIHDRYDTPLSRLTVLPTIFDAAQFDPKTVKPERIERVRHGWGISPSCRVVLAPGRMVRRKGHHLIVKAAARLKAGGVKDFMVVFTGEDSGRTSYTGQLWDLITASGTNDVVRLAGPGGDLPAAFAASAAAVFASTQTEGTQRAVLGAQAMGVPAIVSDLSVGPDIVLSPPSVSEERMTGLRFTSGDDAALAAALIKMLGLPETTRRAIGSRGRNWVLAHHDAEALADRTLRLYVDLAKHPLA